MGLLLFNIIDLPKATDHPMIWFADDSTTVFKVIKTLDNIINWLTCNLQINLDKTFLITFRNMIPFIANFNIEYLGTKNLEIYITEFLRFTTDSSLNWTMHIENLYLKLNIQLYTLYMLTKEVCEPTVLSTYHGYIRSLLRSIIMFWGHSI